MIKIILARCPICNNALAYNSSYIYCQLTYDHKFIHYYRIMMLDNQIYYESIKYKEYSLTNKYKTFSIYHEDKKLFESTKPEQFSKERLEQLEQLIILL